MKRLLYLILAAITLLVACDQRRDYLRLHYDKPADSWEKEALPLGNGYVGVMFFGGYDEERLQVCEQSLWRNGQAKGKENEFGIRKGAYKSLDDVRKLLFDGKYQRALTLANKKLTGLNGEDVNNPNMQYGDYGAQQTMGDLYVSVENQGAVDDYERELDISNATARVNYSAGGVNYNRRYFGNYPSKVFVYEFMSDAKRGSDYVVEFKTPHNFVSQGFDDGIYTFRGEVNGNSMPFEYRLRIEVDRGDVSFANGRISVDGANRLTIYQAAATNYTNSYPDYNGNDYVAENDAVFASVATRTTDELYQEHVADYHALFNRVNLDLGEVSDELANMTTDERLRRYYTVESDPVFEALFFQFNRYLMIAGSRPGTLPLNLQGKWNDSVDPEWAADYHMSINQQMLYWAAESANLSECHTPMIDYVASLVEPGRVAAHEFFGVRGWTVGVANNPFGNCSNGWGFPWGYFPAAGAWIARDVWEHYLYTGDKEFLRHTGYPIMKEAAIFWVDFLIEDRAGNLISCPSYSPDHGTISVGSAIDHQIAWDILDNCVEACKALGHDDEFMHIATQTRDKISKPKIGKWGQLQEWEQDIDKPQVKHRHLSHLFAVYPGNQISSIDTPELMEAAKVSLNARGDEGTGWSLAWKVNLWARFKDGNRAYKLLKNIVNPQEEKNTIAKRLIEQGEKINLNHIGGCYPNLFTAHPPFQLDGNMGSAAGMIEMLMQSHNDEITILPALPDVWRTGKISGVKARGNFELAFEWVNGRVVSLSIKPYVTNRCTIVVNAQELKLSDLALGEWNMINLNN